jgi:hypothetical protein
MTPSVCSPQYHAACVAETSFFEREWQRAYWGPNYPKLLKIKKKYDPTGLYLRPPRRRQ